MIALNGNILANLFELPKLIYLHCFIRNWVVLNKDDEESFFSLPLMLCFGKKIRLTQFHHPYIFRNRVVFFPDFPYFPNYIILII